MFNCFKYLFLLLWLMQSSCSRKAGPDKGPDNSSIPLSSCKLPNVLPRNDVGIGFPKFANRLRSIGDVKIAVIFVDFSDAPATQTPQQVFSILTPTAENYFSKVSYGKLNLILQPKFKWYRMSKPSGNYNWAGLTFAAHKAYIQEALTLADPEVDFLQSDAFLIVANPYAVNIAHGPAFGAAPGQGVIADGKAFENGVTSGADLLNWGGLWLNHELGHAMSLVDLYDFTGSTHRFVGEFSLMGLISGVAPEFFGWERWLEGWITDDQVIACGTGMNTFYLTPLETQGGRKLAVVPIGSTSAIVVESRHALGADQNLPKSGPIVYIIDTNIPSGSGTIKILPVNDNDNVKTSNILMAGQSVTYNNVTVQFLSNTTDGDQIKIIKN